MQYTKVLIMDVQIEENPQIDVFDFEYAKAHYHATFLPICFLVDQCRKAGIEVLTPEQYFKNILTYKNKERYLFSHLQTDKTLSLLKSGVIPLLLTCQESPLIATRFYVLLRLLSSKFIYTMIFPGAQNQISKKTILLPMYFPQIPPTISIPDTEFIQRKNITAVVGYKPFKKTWKIPILNLLFSSNIKNLGSDRIKSITHLMEYSNLELYGKGWKNFDTKIQVNYKGPIADKIITLSGYKFCLCFENASMDGYITEKIFDCFFAGTIPIYNGAPDIAKYIPQNTFIDFSKFDSLSNLSLFINNIDEQTFKDYISNAKIFLRSDAYKKFSHTEFSSLIIKLIQKK